MLPPGGEAELGLIRLQPAASRSYLEGRASLACPGATCDPGGIRVEVPGRPFLTFTASDGSFHLSVVEGTYDLQLSFAGYSPQTLRLDFSLFRHSQGC